jgi:hypothetical protein
MDLEVNCESMFKSTLELRKVLREIYKEDISCAPTPAAASRPGSEASFCPRQLKTRTRTKKNIGVVFSQKKQEHKEAGTAKQGTGQSL